MIPHEIGGCKNSLTPFAGEGGSLSMPAKFYWDGVMFIILGTVGLLGGIHTIISCSYMAQELKQCVIMKARKKQ